jgi:hypothetical protein
MKRLTLLFSLLVSGCEDRRSFDERYDETQANLEQRMNRLEIQANALNESAEVNRN